MPVVQEIHVGDIGTTFVVTLMDRTTVVDISAASTMQIILKPPKGAKLTKTATHVTDGEDGKMKYPTIAGDLNVPGQWQIQAYIVLSGGSWRSSKATFEVFANL